jgi:phenylacetate-CoA ligase
MRSRADAFISELMQKPSTARTTLPVISAVRGMASRVETLDSSRWMRVRARTMLAVFGAAAARVPAYRAFLASKKVRASAIHTPDDFIHVPVTSKVTYLKQYPIAQLCFDGTLARPSVFSSTSGSTGAPFYFPRLPNLEEEYSVLLELFLRNSARRPDPQQPTLVIVAFGMGVWIGGILTYRAFDLVSRRGYPLAVLPTGINKAEILKALRDLAPSFSQTVIAGYPPFIKDVLDEAELDGIDLKALNLRLLFAAEAFTEGFRDYLAAKTGMRNPYRDTLNIYGTADIGAMAFETPTAILIRRLVLAHPELRARLFGETQKTPTLAQYNPSFVCFEAPEGEILVTGYSAIPLIRYAIGDRGGVYSFAELESVLSEAGINLRKEAKKVHIPLYELPFVYVYERSDLATTLYGLQIYPEYLRDFMVSEIMQRYCTGKFQIMQRYDEAQNQYLEIHIERKSGVDQVSRAFAQEAEKGIEAAFREKSSEYRELTSFVKARKLFKLVFDAAGDSDHFPSGVKQRWVRK